MKRVEEKWRIHLKWKWNNLPHPASLWWITEVVLLLSWQPSIAGGFSRYLLKGTRTFHNDVICFDSTKFLDHINCRYLRCLSMKDFLISWMLTSYIFMIWSKHKWESRMTNIFLLYYQVKQVYIYFSYIYLLSKSLDGKFTWNVCIFCVLCTELNTGYISSKYIQERIPK
jgi:hypothetical protein